MSLRVIGLNHRSAPLEVREQLAFSPAQAADALTAWQDQTSGIEAVLLSTCNRTELYAASQESELPATEQLLQFLLAQKTSPVQGFTLASQIFTFDNTDAAEHLFGVASGLDSMVLGEVQILSQVKSAYQLALEAETTGTWTHTLFQTALKTAKRVAAETALHQHRISIPSIAVADFALRVFDHLTDKQILLFGAGDMGQETLRYLIEYGAKKITILNRSRERAETLAAQFNGQTADWEKRVDLMTEADIVISTTSASEPVITFADYKAIESKRQGRTLFVLDLAVPRDFDSAIGKCSGVYLYAIDDLQETCNKNRGERDREIPKAEKIVRQSAADFMKEMTYRQNGAVIQQLREHWTKTKDAEIQRLFNKLPELPEREREEIRYAFERLMKKYLHSPLESLRDETLHDGHHHLLEALKKLFRL
jgi:glutamyl-tRNA reductase